MADYGSSDAGASLGDILGAALRSKQQEAGDQDADDQEDSAEAADEDSDDAAEEKSTPDA